MGLRGRRGIVVVTTARWHWTPDTAWRGDVLLVDEAWQMTYADLGALGAVADQVVLVGDPGQIAPVVAADTSRWDTWPAGLHRPAPALTAAFPDQITHLRLPRTWRLGPQTTALIQPTFYPDLPFGSARPDRHVSVRGDRLPEITSTPVTTVSGPSDPAIAAAAAEQVHDLLDGGQVHSDGTTRALTPDNIAVVVPHVGQAAVIAAHLAHIPGILIGTANQAQGLEKRRRGRRPPPRRVPGGSALRGRAVGRAWGPRAPGRARVRDVARARTGTATADSPGGLGCQRSAGAVPAAARACFGSAQRWLIQSRTSVAMSAGTAAAFLVGCAWSVSRSWRSIS